MARTGLSTIKIRNAGSPLGTGGFTTIDLIGTVSGVDEGNGVVGITGVGGGTGTNIDTQPLTPTQSGSDITLNLASLPHTLVALEVVFRNGQALSPSLWSRVGNTVTVFNADASEVFMVQYTY